jgi:hypothetical protein
MEIWKNQELKEQAGTAGGLEDPTIACEHILLSRPCC